LSPQSRFWSPPPFRWPAYFFCPRLFCRADRVAVTPTDVSARYLASPAVTPAGDAGAWIPFPLSSAPCFLNFSPLGATPRDRGRFSLRTLPLRGGPPRPQFFLPVFAFLHPFPALVSRPDILIETFESPFSPFVTSQGLLRLPTPWSQASLHSSP